MAARSTAHMPRHVLVVVLSQEHGDCNSYLQQATSRCTRIRTTTPANKANSRNPLRTVRSTPLLSGRTGHLCQQRHRSVHHLPAEHSQFIGTSWSDYEFDCSGPLSYLYRQAADIDLEWSPASTVKALVPVDEVKLASTGDFWPTACQWPRNFSFCAKGFSRVANSTAYGFNSLPTNALLRSLRVGSLERGSHCGRVLIVSLLNGTSK